VSYKQNRFCEKAETAQLIDEEITSNSALTKLTGAELLKAYFWEEKENQNQNNKTKIEDTSDRRWPIEIQMSWLHFIMGVSEMLLALIDNIKEESSPNLSEPINLIESYYLKIHKRLSEIWHIHGSHAFLHHINALFGYVPLIAHPRNILGIITTF